jgi:D-xylose transport system substrate-binding protein
VNFAELKHCNRIRGSQREVYRRRRVIATGVFASLALTLAACGSSSSQPKTSGSAGSAAASGGSTASVKGDVYFMIPDTTPSRYIQQDGPDFATALKKLAPGVTVQFVNAGGNQTTQQTQAEAAITAGAKALVVVAADPPLSGGLVAYAHKYHVPVIGYENVPEDGPMYAQVEFNPLEAGTLQGGYFAQQVTSGALGAYPVKIARLYGNQGDVYNTQMLVGQNKYVDPLVKAGKVQVVCESYTPNWAEAAAVTEMSQCLSKTGNGVRAVLGVYDGITQGAIVAIDSAHLTAGSGKNDVAVFGGQNPTTVGLDYMLTGEQQDDVIKPFIYEADAAAKLTATAIQGKEPPAGMINAKVDAGQNNLIPTDFLNESYITAGSNVAALINKYVVQTNTFSWAQICVGSVISTAGCQQYGK